jgi:hypothetical protein
MTRKSIEFLGETSCKVKQLAYQLDENGIIWVLDDKGSLFGVTYDRQAGTRAPHYHQFGGTHEDTVPKVISMCVLPSVDGGQDDLWLLIKRTIGGGDKWYIEKLSHEYQLATLLTDADTIDDKPIYMDSATYFTTASETAIITGLSHLEGEEVGVIADGIYLGTYTVVGNQVVLDSTFEQEAIVGLLYTGTITLLPIEAGSVYGNAVGEIKRASKLAIRFMRTVSAKLGTDSDNLKSIDFPADENDATLPTPLYTGTIVEEFPGDYDVETNITIVQDRPEPMSITNISIKGSTSD